MIWGYPYFWKHPNGGGIPSKTIKARTYWETPCPSWSLEMGCLVPQIPRKFNHLHLVLGWVRFGDSKDGTYVLRSTKYMYFCINFSFFFRSPVTFIFMFSSFPSDVIAFARFFSRRCMSASPWARGGVKSRNQAPVVARCDMLTGVLPSCKVQD